MSARTILAALAGLVAIPASADTYLASNDLVVEARGGDEFHIPYRGKSGASDFWCAAGDYVIQHLHRPRTTRIWRVSPPPRHSGEGITFSLSPERAAGSTGLATFGAQDGSLSAEQARQLCEPVPLFNFR